MSEKESTPENVPPASAETTQPVKPSAVPKRDQNFRKELLKKLPPLGHADWSIKENFKFDQEWGTVVNLKADPLLEALEKVSGSPP